MALGSSLALSRIARESELTAIRRRVSHFADDRAGDRFEWCGLGELLPGGKIMPGMSKKGRRSATRLGFWE